MTMRVLLVGLLTMGGLLAPMSAANAAPCYVPPVINLSIDDGKGAGHNEKVGGEDVRVKAETPGFIVDWDLTIQMDFDFDSILQPRQVTKAQTSLFEHTYKSRPVPVRTPGRIKAHVQWDKDTACQALGSTAAASQAAFSPRTADIGSLDQEIAVVLIPVADAKKGTGLPNTGGLSLWLVAAGVVLTVGGGVLVARQRRQH